ncbi:hypothetical protein MiHa_03640 [Microcystis aeruginosa NIES-2522]|nr:hypothetical protein MiHa_03640 [Microcystis aeruginosa NIES-2522]
MQVVAVQSIVRLLPYHGRGKMTVLLLREVPTGMIR